MTNDIPEDLASDQDLNLTALVHENIAATETAIKLFRASLMDRTINVFSVDREIVEALVTILETSNKMVRDMFEENTMFHEKAMKWQQLRERGRGGDSDRG